MVEKKGYTLTDTLGNLGIEVDSQELFTPDTTRLDVTKDSEDNLTLRIQVPDETLTTILEVSQARAHEYTRIMNHLILGEEETQDEQSIIDYVDYLTSAIDSLDHISDDNIQDATALVRFLPEERQQLVFNRIYENALSSELQRFAYDAADILFRGHDISDINQLISENRIVFESTID